ncbi:dTMP kinase [Brachybacterium endophyticum]|nr:dTMP kinase [Brachybacterium endophyticum]
MTATSIGMRTLLVPSPRPPRRGIFISFEGGEAAGKTTQIGLLREHLLTEREVSEDLVLTTREPGGTELGTSIRGLLLHGGDVTPRAEALMYAADRAHHIETVVRPHLARGGLVLADRYLDSSIAYQGVGRDLKQDQIAALNLWATDGLLPHRTILLDLPPDALSDRREAHSLDRLEREGREFHDAVRTEFLDLAQAEPERFVIVDASRTPQEVHQDVLAAIGEDLAQLDPTFEPDSTHPGADER